MPKMIIGARGILTSVSSSGGGSSSCILSTIGGAETVGSCQIPLVIRHEQAADVVVVVVVVVWINAIDNTINIGWKIGANTSGMRSAATAASHVHG
jgi:hypothetical protein